MNETWCKSNSGEGGEDKARLHNRDLNPKIKQIASGRFGVTPRVSPFKPEGDTNQGSSRCKNQEKVDSLPGH